MDTNKLQSLLDQYRAKKTTVQDPYRGTSRPYSSLARPVQPAQPVRQSQPTVEPDYQEPGVLGQAREALTESYYGARGAFGGAMEAIGHGLNAEGLEAYGESVSNKWKKKLEDNPELAAPEDMKKWSDPRFYARGIGALVPSLGGALASGVVGSVAGTAIGGPAGAVVGGLGAAASYGATLEGGYAFREALDNGATKDEALKIANRVAAINGILEATPIGKLLTKSPAGSALKQGILRKVAGKIASQGLAEGSTEALQEIVNNVYQKEFDKNRGMFDGALESGFFGAIAGGALGPLSREQQAPTNVPVTHIPRAGARVPVREETPNRVLGEGQVPLALPGGRSTKPIIPSQDTPLAAFQMVNPAEQEAINKVVKRLEAAKKKKEKTLKDGRNQVETKASLATINSAIAKLKEKISGMKDTQQVTTGPVSAPVKQSPPIRLPAAKTQKQNKIELSELDDNGEVTAKRVVTFTTSSNGKQTVVIDNEKGDNIDIISRDKAEKKYKTTDDKVLADRIVNGRYESRVDRWRIVTPRKTEETAGDDITSQIERAKTEVNGETQPQRTTPQKETSKPPKVKESKSYKQIAEEARVIESKKKTEGKSSAVQRIMAGRKTTKPTVKTEVKEEIKETPRRVTKKTIVTDVELNDKLKKMLKDGKTENDFMEMEFKATEDFQAGKTRTDESIAIGDFIEENFRKGGEMQYSKRSTTIDSAQQRSFTPTLQNQKPSLFNRLFKGAKSETEFKLFDKAQALIRKYGKLVAETGTPRRSAGVHYKKTGNILVKSLNDIPVVAHEITHRLDKVLEITERIMKNGDDKILNELSGAYFSYYPGANKKAPNTKQAIEGFATLIQNYTLKPTEIAGQFPTAVKEILRSGGKYYEPRVGELIKDVDSIIGEYQALTASKRIGARILTGRREVPKSETFNALDSITTFFADYVQPMEKLERIDGTYMTKDAPSVYFRHRRNVMNVALYNVSNDKGWYKIDLDGNITKVFDYNLRTLGKELMNNGDYDLYNSYLIARRVFNESKELEELSSKSVPSKEDSARIKQLEKIKKNESWNMDDVNLVVEESEGKFKEYDKKYDSINRELLKLLIESKIVDKDAGERMLATKGYAPFFRSILDEIEKETVMGTRGTMPSTKLQTLFEREGSDKPITDPFINAVQAGMHVFDKVMLQRTFELLYKSDIGDAIQEIESQPIPMGSKIIYPQNKGNIISFKYDGKVRTLKLTSKLAEVFRTDLELRNQGRIANIVKSFSRLFVKSTTGALYPAFMFTNILIDTPSAYAQSKNNVLPIFDGIYFIAKAKANKESFEAKTWEEYSIFGGLDKTQIAMYDKSPQEIAKEIGINNIVRGRVKETISNIGELLAKPSKYSEAINRYSEYHKSRLEGKSQAVAMEESARVTASFSHRGKLFGPISRLLLQSVPYGNSPLQVTASTIRALKDPDTRAKAIVVNVVLAAFSIGGFMSILYNYNKAKEGGDEDEIDEMEALLNDYKNFNVYSLGNNLISMSLFGDKDRLVKVRTPANYNIVGTLVSMALAESLMGKEFDYSDYLKAAKDPIVSAQFDIAEPVKMASSWLTPPMKAVVESGLGKKTFPEVKDLEPFYMKTWNSEDRYFPYTNDIAVLLGQTEVMKDKKISPLQIEHFMKTILGRGIENLFKTMSDGLPGMLKIQTEELNKIFQSKTFEFSGVGFQKFYEDRQKINNDYAKANKASDRVKLRELSTPNKIYNKISSAMTDLRKINSASEEDIPIKYSNDIYRVIELLNKGEYDKAESEYRDVIRGINSYISSEQRKLR